MTQAVARVDAFRLNEQCKAKPKARLDRGCYVGKPPLKLITDGELKWLNRAQNLVRTNQDVLYRALEMQSILALLGPYDVPDKDGQSPVAWHKALV